MAIIRYTKEENIRYAYLNIFPDQFKTIKPVDKSVQMYLIFLMLEHNLEVNKSGINAIINSNGMAYINEDLQLKILNYYRHIEQLASREEITNSDIKLMYEPYVKANYPWIYNRTNPWPRQTEFYINDPRPVASIDEKSLLSDKQLEVMIFGRRFQSMRLRSLYSNTIALAEEIIADIEN